MRLGAIVFSLIAHILLVAALVFFKSQPEIKPEPLVFEIQEPVVVKKITNFSSHEKSKRVKNSNPVESKLFPQINLLDTAEKNALSEFQQNAKYKFNDSRMYDSDVDEIFGENNNQNWSYFQEIYRKIDSYLVFDSILAQYNHFGRVYVQFKVTDEGVFQLDELSAQAEDAILKVHVLRAIQKSLKEPLDFTKIKKIEAITLFKAEFDFSFGSYQQNLYKQKNFGKPVFVFKRATEEKPVPEDLIEQLLTGGVTPNVSLMYERWKKYNKKRFLNAVKFDPFESYRRDPFYSL